MSGTNVKSLIPKSGIQTDGQLHDYIRNSCGIIVPDKQVCKNHVSPFEALSDAFFARSVVSVWKASRGFGGKTVLLASLVFAEITGLGASANLLGGSGEQSERAHEYMKGDDTNLGLAFWGWPNAPTHLLASDPTARNTRLTNGGRVRVLMASQKSVRGPHPQRLRMDEADEADIAIVDSALGQPMSARGITAHTCFSSTHQYADGTMTEILKRAPVKGWPIYEWCWRENLEPHGWLMKSEVERKRMEVTENMWDTEYDLQEPNPGARAINPDHVERMFSKELGEYRGSNGEYIEIEEPDPKGTYSSGADWAKKRDHTVIITLRTDVKPYRVVAYERMQRLPWPVMIERYNERLRRFDGQAMHDATGIGDVVDDYLTEPATGFIMVGRPRSDLLSEYTAAIERDEIISPHIETLYSEHKFASVDDLYSPSSHLPDTISAGAFAYRGANAGIGIY